MRFTTKEFNRFVMINNRVLLRAVQDTGYIMLGDTKIEFRSGSSDNSAVVIYEVIKVPQKITKLPPGTAHAIEWDTEMELVPGDKVWINRTIAQTCDKIEFNGEEYLFVHYQYCYLTIRRWNPIDDLCQIIIDPDGLPDDLNIDRLMDTFKETGMILMKPIRQPAIIVTNTRHKRVPLPDNVYREDKKVGKYVRTTFYKIVMLNGYVLFKNVPLREKREIRMLNPEYYDWVGRVSYTGSLNKGYKYHKWPDANYIHPGNLIHLKHKHRKALEYSLHAEFLDKGPYYVTQRSHILGKIVFRDI